MSNPTNPTAEAHPYEGRDSWSIIQKISLHRVSPTKIFFFFQIFWGEKFFFFWFSKKKNFFFSKNEKYFFQKIFFFSSIKVETWVRVHFTWELTNTQMRNLFFPFFPQACYVLVKKRKKEKKKFFSTQKKKGEILWSTFGQNAFSPKFQP